MMKIAITITVSVPTYPLVPPTAYSESNTGDSVAFLNVDDALGSNLLIDSAKE